MYRYKFSIWINNNNSFYTKTGIVEFPKERYSWTVNDPDKHLICRKAAAEIGEDPDQVDLGHSNTHLQCLGKVKSDPPSPKVSAASTVNPSYTTSKGPSFEEKLLMKELEIKEREMQEKADLEREKFEFEKSQREKAARKAKADQLRREGKTFLAFVVEYQNAVIATIAIPAVAIAFYFMVQSTDNEAAEATRINTELEQIEDSIKLLINEQNYDRALVLTNKLVHPISIVYEGKGTVWEPMCYDQYWDQKRAEYKEMILSAGQPKVSEPTGTKSDSKQVNETETQVNSVPEPMEQEIEYEEGLSDEYKM